jgi:integrase/recombinase XerD
MNCKKCKKEIPDESIYCMWCGRKQVAAQRKALKRENGTGSVYKRADVKSRPWVAVAPLKNGKREVIGTFATAHEAKDALEDYRRNPTDRLNITLKSLYEEWKPIGYKDK